jgi:squalene-associated FAD-dependent desaturase
MASILVVGGGLAGLSSAAALGAAGWKVDLFEARGFLGGRATSYPLPDGSEVIDNCQHVLLACFTSLLDFYGRLGVRDRIRFHRDFYFVEPGGRVSVLRDGLLSFAHLRFLGWKDKLAIARALRAIPRERRREDLDRITMLEWLNEQRQTPRAIGRFWRQVLVSAINEDLEGMAAGHGLQVFWLGFLAGGGAHHMGLSTVPLSELYAAAERLENVRVHLREPIERLRIENGRVSAAVAEGREYTADAYISALPFERVPALAPELGLDITGFSHSPITGIHLWFDRPVMDLPQAVLLDRTVQWAFNKEAGRYIQLVVSASRSLVEMPRQHVVALAARELAEFFPRAGAARIEKAHVVKEIRATFSARPGLEALRPPAATAIPNLFLAGDWTRTGWPATMEGAVRSGCQAAEAVLRKL